MDLEKIFSRTSCRVCFDNLTRQLYATDASIYQIIPSGVAFPKCASEAADVVRIASQENIPIIPRGAGTGLSGGAIGTGIVMDMSRHNRNIWCLDKESMTVWVEPGVILDHLNAYLKPYKLCFGADVATSSRATLGGMISNNSSGAHAIIQGTTSDHLLALQLIMANGEIVELGNEESETRESDAKKSPDGDEEQKIKEIQRTLNSLVGDVESLEKHAKEQKVEELRRSLISLVESHASAIEERFSEKIYKRWPGYGLSGFLHTRKLPRLFSGSEGTLGIIAGAKLKLIPLNQNKALAVISFDKVIDAMEATVEIMKLGPSAVEHIDIPLFGETRGQPQFREVRNMLKLDEDICESLLLVEFYDDLHEKMELLKNRRFGKNTFVFYEEAEMDSVWNMRKAGLSLLNGRPGPSKPMPGIEDAAVATSKLPAYVRSLQKLFAEMDVKASFYGHAGPGLLHVRPLLDLHTADGVNKLRKITNEVLHLVKEFKGSIAAEHGLGIERTEYLEEHIGTELMDLTREIKKMFDPSGILNPGKIVGNGNFKLDRNLRFGNGYQIKPPFTPALAFAAKDKSFVGNLEQCNGCGHCIKETTTMCPTYQATGDEMMSTRGRCNLIRAVLDGRCDSRGQNIAQSGQDQNANLNEPGQEQIAQSDMSQKAGKIDRTENATSNRTENATSNRTENATSNRTQNAASKRLGLWELDQAIQYCLSCKACVVECPSNVDMSLLKAELLYAKQRQYGVSLRDHAISSVEWMGKMSWRVAPLANFFMELKPVRMLMRKLLGFTTKRPLPHYASLPFHQWFRRRKKSVEPVSRIGSVILWDDTFVRYYEPHIAQQATRVLEALGYEVKLVHGHGCCGRPSFSVGRLDKAYRTGCKNIELIRAMGGKEEIVFLEPSSFSMFSEDYRELKVPFAEEIAPRAILFESFLDKILATRDTSKVLKNIPGHIAVHVHCHAKKVTDAKLWNRLLSRFPNAKIHFLSTGCCGMAGAFGMLESKYDISVQVAKPLVNQIQSLPLGTKIVACGTSCRQQIRHLTNLHPLHVAELFGEALNSI